MMENIKRIAKKLAPIFFYSFFFFFPVVGSSDHQPNKDAWYKEFSTKDQANNVIWHFVGEKKEDKTTTFCICVKEEKTGRSLSAKEWIKIGSQLGKKENESAQTFWEKVIRSIPKMCADKGWKKGFFLKTSLKNDAMVMNFSGETNYRSSTYAEKSYKEFHPNPKATKKYPFDTVFEALKKKHNRDKIYAVIFISRSGKRFLISPAMTKTPTLYHLGKMPAQELFGEEKYRMDGGSKEDIVAWMQAIFSLWDCFPHPEDPTLHIHGSNAFASTVPLLHQRFTPQGDVLQNIGKKSGKIVGVVVKEEGGFVTQWEAGIFKAIFACDPPKKGTQAHTTSSKKSSPSEEESSTSEKKNQKKKKSEKKDALRQKNKKSTQRKKWGLLLGSIFCMLLLWMPWREKEKKSDFEKTQEEVDDDPAIE